MSIKIPAIKSSIGDWTYYTTSLTFRQIVQMVDKMSDEIYQSSSLKEALQRSITENYKNIEQYIISQDERFFNSIVLAMYDGEPKWIQVDLELDEEIFHNVGFLKLNGEEHIFPVDGQHRVEGIKAVLVDEENRNRLQEEKIPVVFIGHKTTEIGMQRSRRLFNTLNRYAKPVSQSDIVILDEDDTSAITTRFLIEDSIRVNLFKGDRLDDSLQKAINKANKTSFTSLIAFYECNEAIQKYYFNNIFFGTEAYKNYKDKYYSNKAKKINFKDFKRYRPDKSILDDFMVFTENYWTLFEESFTFINEYLLSEEEFPAYHYRRAEIGGNILFRPIGIVPFVEATLKALEKVQHLNMENIFSTFAKMVEFSLSEKPWRNVVWSSQDYTMLTVPKPFIRNMFLFMLEEDILTENENYKLVENYAKFITYEGDISSMSLDDLLKI